MDNEYIRKAAAKENWFRCFSTERPASIGTQPVKGFMDFINYDKRTEVDGYMVWAELYYNRELTEDELRDYELVRG